MYDYEHYIILNGLQDSYIDKKILYQYRNVLPQRKYVGRSESGYRIFYEETQGSLKKRNYGKSNKVTSWNLLYSNGDTSNLVTKAFINNNDISYYDGFSKERVLYFLNNNTKYFNALDDVKTERKRRSLYVNDDELEVIQEILKKMRGEK